MGRVVITHSTYIDGLIPWLKRLSLDKEIRTITPGVINRVKGQCPLLTIRVSVKTLSGYKLVARVARSAQEVFVVTEMSKEELIKRIKRSKP